nr:hypothetical protein [Streptomyces chartreusis]
MSSGDIAIVIASASALFTGLNMTFSALTYNRVRPKVEVLMEIFSVPGDSNDEEDPHSTFRLRHANRSATAVGVEAISLKGSHGRGHRKQRFGKVHVADEPLQVEPLSGVKAVEKLRKSTILRDGTPPDRFAITLGLTNGKTARTKIKLRPCFVDNF